MNRPDDPNFTGIISCGEPQEIVRIATPFAIKLSRVDNVQHGKVRSVHYNWSVELRGQRIAYNSAKHRLPRTRKAAIAQARAAIRSCVNEFLREIDRGA